ncbi:MAG TPA: hypothetical protein PLB45_02915 [Bacilli bacterium]|nr:hypothetical protein [Bacilli bacterium]HQC83805.1 hypothetical protein [Bacilli bacterium]
MNSNESYKKYIDALNERIELENKINEYVEKWKNGETVLSNESIQGVMEKANDRLANLRSVENQLHDEFIKQDRLDSDKEMADIVIRQYLGVTPTDINITGGVLASKGDETHLDATKKSIDQLEQERQYLLTDIDYRVQSGKMLSTIALKLVDAVNTSYDYYVQDNRIRK